MYFTRESVRPPLASKASGSLPYAERACASVGRFAALGPTAASPAYSAEAVMVTPTTRPASSDELSLRVIWPMRRATAEGVRRLWVYRQVAAAFFHPKGCFGLPLRGAGEVALGLLDDHV